jgi:hypothetical protein
LNRIFFLKLGLFILLFMYLCRTVQAKSYKYLFFLEMALRVAPSNPEISNYFNLSHSISWEPVLDDPNSPKKKFFVTFSESLTTSVTGEIKFQRPKKTKRGRIESMAPGYYLHMDFKNNSAYVQRSKPHDILPVCCPHARSRPPPLPGGLGNHFRGYFAIHGYLCKDFRIL